MLHNEGLGMAYTKTHSPWVASDLLSGYAFNHLESQWTASKADADAHNHDTRYYTKASSDATFFSTTFYTNFDADKLDGSHLSDIVASVMPLGAIMIWSGTDATVPTGWHICDGGTYGSKVSPDLRDRFVIGAGSTYAVNASPGVATWNATITPTAAVTIGDHILTTSEIPGHTHDFTAKENAKNLAANTNNIYANCKTLSSRTSTFDEQSSGDGAHGHTGSTASFTAVNPRPAFYSLYYIMKYA
jgi:hypothetical protein